jgi:hypothetical protein
LSRPGSGPCAFTGNKPSSRCRSPDKLEHYSRRRNSGLPPSGLQGIVRSPPNEAVSGLAFCGVVIIKPTPLEEEIPLIRTVVSSDLMQDFNSSVRHCALHRAFYRKSWRGERLRRHLLIYTSLHEQISAWNVQAVRMDVGDLRFSCTLFGQIVLR